MVRHDGDQVAMDLLHSLGQLVLDVLAHVARGVMVTFVPYGAELSTKEAAIRRAWLAIEDKPAFKDGDRARA